MVLSHGGEHADGNAQLVYVYFVELITPITVIFESTCDEKWPKWFSFLRTLIDNGWR